MSDRRVLVKSNRGLGPVAFTPERAVTIDQILARAIKILSAKSRWAYGALAYKKDGKTTVQPESKEASCFCGQGAIRRAAYELSHNRRSASSTIWTVETVAGNIVAANDADDPFNYPNLLVYNDEAMHDVVISYCGNVLSPLNGNRKEVLDLFRETRKAIKKGIKAAK